LCKNIVTNYRDAGVFSFFALVYTLLDLKTYL